jgi:hypothetical protein
MVSLESTRQIKSKSFIKGSEKSSVRGTEYLQKHKKALIFNEIEAFLFISTES